MVGWVEFRRAKIVTLRGAGDETDETDEKDLFHFTQGVTAGDASLEQEREAKSPLQVLSKILSGGKLPHCDFRKFRNLMDTSIEP